MHAATARDIRPVRYLMMNSAVPPSMQAGHSLLWMRRGRRPLVYAGADSLDAPDARRSMNALPLCMAFAAFGCAVPTRS